jgi:hypothetical protein
VLALGTLDAPQDFGTFAEEIRNLKSILSGKVPPALPERIDPAATMPTQEPERTAEAVRRALPELLKLDRYESRLSLGGIKPSAKLPKDALINNTTLSRSFPFSQNEANITT